MNRQQRAAAEHGLDGEGLPPPLLILAGAGCGKTMTLVHRVAALLARGADPERILLLTFSRRAALEMTRRVETLGRGRLRWAGTFHAIGHRLLRLHAAAIGLDPGFTILDREDAADLIDLVRDELGLAALDKRFPRKATCLAIYSYVVNAGVPLEAALARAFPWCADWEGELQRLFAAYVEGKQRAHVLDYDDLLLYWAQILQVPELAANLAARFDHVLVDEYQDTNAIQAAILLGLKPDGRGLTVVGDDAQAIYSFRAATVRNILDFPGRFTPPAAIAALERNYRSTDTILAAANAVMARAAERLPKELTTERRSAQKPRLAAVADEAGQVGYIATEILAQREAGVTLRRQAVLFRTASHSAALEVELTRRNIPFVKYGGLRFLEAAHVKDVIAVLRWAENPRDRLAGFRVLQLMPGIGPGIARKALDRFAGAGFALGALASVRPPAAALLAWPALIALLRELRGLLVGWPRQIELACDWYRPLMPALHDSVEPRAAELDQLAQIAASYPTREAFLADLTLDPPSASGDEAGNPRLDDDYLILSTIHSAKGQEWDVVYVLNLVDGCIPSDMASGAPDEIEEERRLLYVAMTRARDTLHLVQPQRFYVHNQHRSGDRHVYAPRSRFLQTAMLPLFERLTWPPPRPEAPPRPAAGPPIDLQARMRAMWR